MTKRISDEELKTLMLEAHFEKRIDPLDARYEITAFRQPVSALSGGLEFTPETWAGLAAVKRADYFFLNNAQGILIAHGYKDLAAEIARATEELRPLLDVFAKRKAGGEPR